MWQFSGNKDGATLTPCGGCPMSGPYGCGVAVCCSVQHRIISSERLIDSTLSFQNVTHPESYGQIKPITMKHLMLFAALLLLAATRVTAQDAKDIARERKEISKLSKNELNARAGKAARKAAKEAARDGWIVAPGSLPLEKQFDRAYNMQYEYDQNAFPKYLMGDAMSPGENYDAAKMQALELAKQNLAGQIQTEMTALIENTVANKQLGAEQASSITETVMASKNLISQKIGRVIPVVECYRTNRNKNKEVRLVIAYNASMALEAAKETVRQQLEQKGDDLHEQLDRVLGF